MNNTEGHNGGSLERMVRRHEMISDDGPTWCKLCGTFDVYCFMANGEMTECFPKPETERWWLPPNGLLTDCGHPEAPK